MDDNKLGCLPSFIAFLFLSFSLAGHSLDLEYVSPEVRQDLEAQFASESTIPLTEAAIKTKEWSCDMYGMRSHLQVKRNVKLYQWKSGSDWENHGAQLIQKYGIEKNVLVGQHDRFEDQVKLDAKGQLLSKLSLTTPQRQVIAYSVCKSI